MAIDYDVEKTLGYPSGLGEDEVITEGQAEAIKAVIAKLSHVKTQADIQSIIKMLRAMVI